MAVRYPQEQTLHLLVPVSLAGSSGGGSDSGGGSGGTGAGAGAVEQGQEREAEREAEGGGSVAGSGAAGLPPRAPASVPSRPQQGGSTVVPAAGTATAAATGTSSRDSAHLTALSAESVVSGTAVAVLRLRVTQRGVGGLHLVLETLQAEPPYLLQNRTPISLAYRQVRGWGDGTACVLSPGWVG